MIFTISILHAHQIYRYKVQRIAINARNETYQLNAKNKTLILTNNRPFLKGKNLKHWKPSWKIQGEIRNLYFKNLIIAALEKEIGIPKK